MEHKKAHEPLLRMAKRGTALPGWKAWGIRLIGFLLSLVACALLIVSVVHISPLKVYGTIINAALGDKTSAWVTTRDAMTMLCIAVGLAPAFKMKFWNIGAEGQILVGGIATAACMIYLKALPPVVLILVMMIASLIAGAAWGFLPGFFKARWNTNETLFTLMMNYIAIQLTSFFVAKWEYPFGSNTVGIINPTGKQGWLPNMFSEGYNGDFGWNVLIVLVVTVGMYLYLSKSKHGYEIAVIGDSVNTARYAGMNVGRIMMRTMFLSGAICGLVGFMVASGANMTLSDTVAAGNGFTAITVAWLSQLNAFAMIVISLMLAILSKGAETLQTRLMVPTSISDIITGILLFCMLGCEFFINYQIIFRGKSGAKEGAKV